MTGTLINMGAIVAGTEIGSLAGSKLPARMRRRVLYGIGLMVFLIGFGIKLLDLKDLPLANFVPAIGVAPAILALIPFLRALF